MATDGVSYASGQGDAFSYGYDEEVHLPPPALLGFGADGVHHPGALHAHAAAASGGVHAPPPAGAMASPGAFAGDGGMPYFSYQMAQHGALYQQQQQQHQQQQRRTAAPGGFEGISFDGPPLSADAAVVASPAEPHAVAYGAAPHLFYQTAAGSTASGGAVPNQLSQQQQQQQMYHHTQHLLEQQLLQAQQQQQQIMAQLQQHRQRAAAVLGGGAVSVGSGDGSVASPALTAGTNGGASYVGGGVLGVGQHLSAGASFGATVPSNYAYAPIAGASGGMRALDEYSVGLGPAPSTSIAGGGLAPAYVASALPAVMAGGNSNGNRQQQLLPKSDSRSGNEESSGSSQPLPQAPGADPTTRLQHVASNESSGANPHAVSRADGNATPSSFHPPNSYFASSPLAELSADSPPRALGLPSPTPAIGLSLAFGAPADGASGGLAIPSSVVYLSNTDGAGLGLLASPADIPSATANSSTAGATSGADAMGSVGFSPEGVIGALPQPTSTTATIAAAAELLGPARAAPSASFDEARLLQLQRRRRISTSISIGGGVSPLPPPSYGYSCSAAGNGQLQQFARVSFLGQSHSPVGNSASAAANASGAGLAGPAGGSFSGVHPNASSHTARRLYSNAGLNGSGGIGGGGVHATASGFGNPNHSHLRDYSLFAGSVGPEVSHIAAVGGDSNEVSIVSSHQFLPPVAASASIRGAGAAAAAAGVGGSAAADVGIPLGGARRSSLVRVHGRSSQSHHGGDGAYPAARSPRPLSASVSRHSEMFMGYGAAGLLGADGAAGGGAASLGNSLGVVGAGRSDFAAVGARETESLSPTAAARVASIRGIGDISDPLSKAPALMGGTPLGGAGMLSAAAINHLLGGSSSHHTPSHSASTGQPGLPRLGGADSGSAHPSPASHHHSSIGGAAAANTDAGGKRGEGSPSSPVVNPPLRGGALPSAASAQQTATGHRTAAMAELASTTSSTTIAGANNTTSTQPGAAGLVTPIIHCDPSAASTSAFANDMQRHTVATTTAGHQATMAAATAGIAGGAAHGSRTVPPSASSAASSSQHFANATAAAAAVLHNTSTGTAPSTVHSAFHQQGGVRHPHSQSHSLPPPPAYGFATHSDINTSTNTASATAHSATAHLPPPPPHPSQQQQHNQQYHNSAAHAGGHASPPSSAATASPASPQTTAPSPSTPPAGPSGNKPLVLYKRIDASGRNLFVSGLHPSIDHRRLRDLFSAYGQINSTRVLYDSHNPSRSKGMGFVHFVEYESVEAAIAGLNGMRVTVEIATTAPAAVAAGAGSSSAEAEASSSSSPAGGNSKVALLDGSGLVALLSPNAALAALHGVAPQPPTEVVTIQSIVDPLSAPLVTPSTPASPAPAPEAGGSSSANANAASLASPPAGGDSPPLSTASAAAAATTCIIVVSMTLQVKLADDDATFIPEETNKLFIRNVPRTISAMQLSAYFSRFGTVVDCTIHRDSSTKGRHEHGGGGSAAANNSQLPSGITYNMAYVTFKTIAEATRAMGLAEGSVPWTVGRYTAVPSPSELYADAKGRIVARDVTAPTPVSESLREQRAVRLAALREHLAVSRPAAVKALGAAATTISDSNSTAPRAQQSQNTNKIIFALERPKGSAAAVPPSPYGYPFALSLSPSSAWRWAEARVAASAASPASKGEADEASEDAEFVSLADLTIEELFMLFDSADDADDGDDLIVKMLSYRLRGLLAAAEAREGGGEGKQRSSSSQQPSASSSSSPSSPVSAHALSSTALLARREQEVTRALTVEQCELLLARLKRSFTAPNSTPEGVAGSHRSSPQPQQMDSSVLNVRPLVVKPAETLQCRTMRMKKLQGGQGQQGGSSVAAPHPGPQHQAGGHHQQQHHGGAHAYQQQQHSGGHHRGLGQPQHMAVQHQFAQPPQHYAPQQQQPPYAHSQGQQHMQMGRAPHQQQHGGAGLPYFGQQQPHDPHAPHQQRQHGYEGQPPMQLQGQQGGYGGHASRVQQGTSAHTGAPYQQALPGFPSQQYTPSGGTSEGMFANTQQQQHGYNPPGYQRGGMGGGRGAGAPQRQAPHAFPPHQQPGQGFGYGNGAGGDVRSQPSQPFHGQQQQQQQQYMGYAQPPQAQGQQYPGAGAQSYNMGYGAAPTPQQQQQQYPFAAGRGGNNPYRGGQPAR